MKFNDNVLSFFSIFWQIHLWISYGLSTCISSSASNARGKRTPTTTMLGLVTFFVARLEVELSHISGKPKVIPKYIKEHENFTEFTQLNILDLPKP